MSDPTLIDAVLRVGGVIGTSMAFFSGGAAFVSVVGLNRWGEGLSDYVNAGLAFGFILSLPAAIWAYATI